ncbi:MAG: Gfo/Idh/MocA family oxidoreductase [Bacteroidetes bacterium]|jgi:predicted dehydrogenase|nr:Gfo/Idh/MocA family oxidoreductase [Bacteroidota bacterium]MBT3748782.1 Gfo/Idh/MocA family oxidoreductase [Bacteroidota bacterium]MBT4401930.1 Gfo/Idh/MocA family oxidoreductase [Bacteroidota bacterium]MBT4409314.1 Gfo/Idh/MocA family oxidoreductase [Bacteroidota bacterium]MBT5426380.1 Gfo/Idh/MocA family oxidoreductase [Bacteroidota bacterium]
MIRMKWGMIGGGKGAFIGGAHRIAAKIANRYELLGGVFDVDFKKAKEFAQEEDLDLNRVYPDIDSFINGEISRPADERIQVVSIVTPNFLHFEHAKKLLDNNFHVICEKPVTLTSAEALELEALVQEKQLVFCLTHTYTGYPMVREMKSRISAGAIGEIQRVEAQYLQGWINPIIHGGDAKLAVWRLDPKVSGISSCMGDIGVHAFNMIEYTTGLETQAVLAVLSNLKPDNPLDLDGNVMLRFKENLTGMVMASQIATGEENNLQISIYGTKGAFHWEQENPNELKMFHEGGPYEVIKPGYDYLSSFAQESHVLPPGHPEGIYEAFGNLYKGAAKAINGEKMVAGQFPGISDGVRGMRFIESVVQSNKDGNIWIAL